MEMIAQQTLTGDSWPSNSARLTFSSDPLCRVLKRSEGDKAIEA